MAHDSDLVHIYDYGDVFISHNLAAANPADTDVEFGVDWEQVGLLGEGTGFTAGSDEDTGEHFSWNGGFLRRHYKNRHETRAFTPIEWNDTVRRIIDRGVFDESELVIPSGPPERCKLALLSRDTTLDYTVIEIWDDAEIVLDGDVVHNEDDITAYEFVAHIFGSGVVGTRLTSDASGS